MTNLKLNNNIKLPAILIMLCSMFYLMSFTVVVQDKPWNVPDEAKNIQNPVDIDDEGISIGKELYTKHCKSCHGKEGLGDGPKAAELDTPSGDFSAEEFQEQSDGSLFYKLTEGRDDMPTFAKKIPDEEDRWLLVHYMRTMAE